jgi:hypothetical protein
MTSTGGCVLLPAAGVCAGALVEGKIRQQPMIATTIEFRSKLWGANRARRFCFMLIRRSK